MRVLFIGKRFYTNRDALHEQYGRVYQLPLHWSRMGISTCLWLVDYHCYKSVCQNDDRLEIISTPVRTFVVFSHWVAQFFARKRKPDIIVASGDCYIGLMAYRIARRLGARFVFDIYDKYDEFGGYRRLLGFDILQYLLRRSDKQLFASRALMEELSTETDRSLLVPNGVDSQRFMPRDMQECRQALGLSADQFLVGYFGGMEADRGVFDLIVAIQQLRSEGMNVELLLGGREVENLDVRQTGVRYLGNIPYDQMSIVLACCDLLAVPYRRSAFMDAGASNKIAEAIACRRPLVATRTPNLVANFPAQAERLDSLLANPGDPSDLARVILAQSARRVLVDMPPKMGWKEISIDVAEKLAMHSDATLSKERVVP